MRLSHALLVSVAVHAAVAAGIAAYLQWSDGAVVTAKLDLSSVELSFAEEDSETAPAIPTVPMPPQEDVPPPPPEEDAAPPDTDLPPPEDPLPPEMDAIKLPEPEPENPRKFDPVDVKDPEPEKKPEPEKEPPKKVEPPPEVPPPAPVAPKSARIDAPPKPRRNIKPEYPKGARQRGEEGNVTVEIRVSGNGTVDSVAVVASCGFKELDDAAVSAARKAVFVPAKIGRKPVPSTARLTLEFKLK